MKKILMSSLLAVLLILSYPNLISAESQSSGKVDDVLVRIDNETIVKVPISTYRIAKKFKVPDIYHYLSSGKGYIEVSGIVSGDKYVYIGEYRINLKFNNPTKSILLAIDRASAITDDISSYNQLVIDGNGNYVKNPDGSIKVEPIFPKTGEFKLLSIY